MVAIKSQITNLLQKTLKLNIEKAKFDVHNVIKVNKTQLNRILNLILTIPFITKHICNNHVLIYCIV